MLRREHIPRRVLAPPTLGPEELGELREACGGRPERRGQEGVAPLVQELERQAQRLS